MAVKIDYLNNPWKPVKHTVFRDDEIANQVYELGYVIKKIISDSQLERLENLYNHQHNIGGTEGGMFYSVYSQNIDYRKRIHAEIGAILQETFDAHFTNFRVVLNSFVVKASGPKSEFYLHQDTTGLDESKYSPLSLWIPLTDVNETNGCLGIIPKSHQFFSPFRSISFPAPFDGIADVVREYIQPLKMRKGEALLFDNRLVHNSYMNYSGQTRVAVICGIFPKEAKIRTCYNTRPKSS